MTSTQSPEEVLSVVSASAPRRWMAVGMQLILGGMLLYIAVDSPPSFLWQVFLVVTGLGALWLAAMTHRGASTEILLTRAGLQDNGGEVLASLEQIARVERGAFAFKPSNGFMLHLKEKSARRWVPGIWWRVRRRIGIGGIAPGHQTKAMAQIIEALIAERDGVSIDG